MSPSTASGASAALLTLATLAACVGVEPSRGAEAALPPSPEGPREPGLRQVKSDAATDGSPFVLVELFTSQGCSSCPSADENLLALSARAAAAGERLFPLSFHVDYWDRLGWADPYGERAHSDRQRAMASRGGWGVYTPQLVVNGTYAFVGSDRSKANRAITTALAHPPALPVSVVATWDPQRPTVSLAWEAPGTPAGTVFTVTLSEWTRQNVVSRGENRGRALSHSQVVRALFEAPASEARGDVTLRLPDDLGGEAIYVTAWVSRPSSGEILGATQVSLGKPHKRDSAMIQRGGEATGPSGRDGG